MKAYRNKGINIFRSSRQIKSSLAKEFNRLGLTNRDVIKDAKENYGFTINESALSKYLKHDKVIKGSLTEKHILFLCMRYRVLFEIVTRKAEYTDQSMNDTLEHTFEEIKKHRSKKKKND